MHPAEKPNELLQCYDKNKKPTEVRARAEVKQMPPRWWYAVCRIWLVNDKGQIMVSKRDGRLSGNPNKWQSYFGGHVNEGQSIKESAKEELAEEAGLEYPLKNFHFICSGQNDEKKAFWDSFAVHFNGQPSDLNFSDGEVTEAKWMDLDEYWDEQKRHPDDWCNSCKPEQQHLIKDWLKQILE